MTADTKQVLTDERMFQILLDHGIGWETGRGLEPMSADDESGCEYIKALRAIEAAVLSASAGAVPEGYALVPIEPTYAMLNAKPKPMGAQGQCVQSMRLNSDRAKYIAMVEAAMKEIK